MAWSMDSIPVHAAPASPQDERANGLSLASALLNSDKSTAIARAVSPISPRISVSANYEHKRHNDRLAALNHGACLVVHLEMSRHHG